MAASSSSSTDMASLFSYLPQVPEDVLPYPALKYATDEEKASVKHDSEVYAQCWKTFKATNKMTPELEKPIFEIGAKMYLGSIEIIKGINPALYQKLFDAFCLAAKELGKCNKDVTPQIEKIFSLPTNKRTFNIQEDYIEEFLVMLKKEKLMTIRKPNSCNIFNWMYHNRNGHPELREIFRETRQLMRACEDIPTSINWMYRNGKNGPELTKINPDH